MKRILIILLLYGSTLLTMEKPSDGHAYTVPFVDKQIFHDTTEQALKRILPDQLLQDQGWIEALIVRPDKNMRTYTQSCEITKTHIIGDKNEKITEHQEFAVVTMMRADVSQAIGGFHLPGDNIHVRGMHMGKKDLDIGDIITILDGNLVMAILILTYMPHQACLKFLSRCGKKAFDLCNNEDAYENGMEVANGKLDGVEQRLRGLRLAVLKAGKVAVGNKVIIERGENKEKRLAQFNLNQFAQELVSKSKEPGLEYVAKDTKLAQMRKEARIKKQAEENTKSSKKSSPYTYCAIV